MRLASIVVIALARCVCAGPAAAQESRATPGGFELGGGLGGSSQGMGAVAALALNTRSGDFLVRGAVAEEFEILSTPLKSSWDVALLYGRTLRVDTNWLRVAAGPAVAHTTRRGEPTACFIVCAYEKQQSQATGVALQVDWVWAFSRFFGLGVSAFADLNGDNSFAGITLGLHVGRLR